MNRLLVDLDRDLPVTAMLERLPRLILDSCLRPVLQLGNRFAWSAERRLRASWVYPEHALVAYAEAVRSSGEPLEIALGRYGMIRGTEEISSFFGRFLALVEGEEVVESEVASHTLFLLELLSDARDLLGPVERVFLFLPRGLEEERERAMVAAVGERLSPEGIALTGVHTTGITGTGEGALVLEAGGGSPAPVERYGGILEGLESTLIAGTRPLWCREELTGRFQELYRSWEGVEDQLSRLWRLARRGEELETALFMAASAGDPSPLAEAALLRREVAESLDCLRTSVGRIRPLLCEVTEDPEPLLLPARAAERAAGKLLARLLPLRSREGTLRYPSPKDEAGIDGY